MKLKNIKGKLKSFFIKLRNKDTSFFIIALCVLLLATAVVWRYTAQNPNQLAQNEEGQNANVDPYKDYVEGVMGDYAKETQDRIDLKTINAPLSGETIKEFSIDELVYFEAIGEWRTHNGVDIKPKETLLIESAFEGTVEKVNISEITGTEIIIDHGNNIKTLYSNLSSAKVKAGDVVEKGQVIGNIGKVDSIESADGPHLHFELMVDGKNVNPLDYIPK